MPYKIYTDKNESFECELSVKNASLKGLVARLIIESENHPALIFNGTVSGNKCSIPIRRLKGILDENTQGKMHLEVIVEDTYFKPWKSDFIVEQHTSVKTNLPDCYTARKEIAYICEKMGIRKDNSKTKRKEMVQLLKEYFKTNSKHNKSIRPILTDIQNFLK